jgi:hypothetical protein
MNERPIAGKLALAGGGCPDHRTGRVGARGPYRGGGRGLDALPGGRTKEQARGLIAETFGGCLPGRASGR